MTDSTPKGYKNPILERADHVVLMEAIMDVAGGNPVKQETLRAAIEHYRAYTEFSVVATRIKTDIEKRDAAMQRMHNVEVTFFHKTRSKNDG